LQSEHFKANEFIQELFDIDVDFVPEETTKAERRASNRVADKEKTLQQRSRRKMSSKPNILEQEM
jgi:hypothetical protein